MTRILTILRWEGFFTKTVGEIKEREREPKKKKKGRGNTERELRDSLFLILLVNEGES